MKYILVITLFIVGIAVFIEPEFGHTYFEGGCYQSPRDNMCHYVS